MNTLVYLEDSFSQSKRVEMSMKVILKFGQKDASNVPVFSISGHVDVTYVT